MSQLPLPCSVKTWTTPGLEFLLNCSMEYLDLVQSGLEFHQKAFAVVAEVTRDINIVAGIKSFFMAVIIDIQ